MTQHVVGMNSRSKGILVAMEGIDGAGKTTQVRYLERLLEVAGIAYIATKEPTQGPWGRRIRASAQYGRMSAEAELQAFVSDRREHVTAVIQPALDADKVVVVDRYYFSTVAYQGARGLDVEYLLEVNRFAPTPDVLVVLDVEPHLGLQRIRQRGDSADLFEKEEELAKVRDIFRGLAVPNLHLLDGTRPPRVLARTIGEIVLRAWASTHPDAALDFELLFERAEQP